MQSDETMKPETPSAQTRKASSGDLPAGSRHRGHAAGSPGHIVNSECVFKGSASQNSH